MKILGVKNNDLFLASVAHYDYRRIDGLCVDGGVPGTNEYAGYNRFSSNEVVWAEVPQTYAELYTDYQTGGKDRKYGLWKIFDIRILNDEEIPDTESFVWKKENAIWGTRGINGDQPLKYIHLIDAETDHLYAILDTQQITPQMKSIILDILKERADD